MMGMDQAQSLRDQLKYRREGGNPCKLIAVASGKGGTGKSVLSVNLALSWARLGQRVLVIDADFGFANIDVMLGTTARYHLGHVLSGKVPLKETIHTGYEGVQFISGGSGVQSLLSMTPVQLKGLLADFLQLEALADMIIFDVGAGASPNIMGILSACDEVFIVTTPEPTSILDAYALVKTLSLGSQSMPRMRLIINRAESPLEAANTLSSFSQVVLKYLKTDMDQLGYVQQDAVVSQAVRMQVPFVISFAQSAPARQVESIARRYLNLPQTQPSGGIQRFFAKLGFGKG